VRKSNVNGTLSLLALALTLTLLAEVTGVQEEGPQSVEGMYFSLSLMNGTVTLLWWLLAVLKNSTASLGLAG
jgi:hypothetical protein